MLTHDYLGCFISNAATLLGMVVLRSIFTCFTISIKYYVSLYRYIVSIMLCARRYFLQLVVKLKWTSILLDAHWQNSSSNLLCDVGYKIGIYIVMLVMKYAISIFGVRLMNLSTWSSMSWIPSNCFPRKKNCSKSRYNILWYIFI